MHAVIVSEFTFTVIADDATLISVAEELSARVPFPIMIEPSAGCAVFVAREVPRGLAITDMSGEGEGGVYLLPNGEETYTKLDGILDEILEEYGQGGWNGMLTDIS